MHPLTRPPAHRLNPRLAATAGLVLGVATLAALHIGRGIAYWDYSEGVYVFTSRLLLHGYDMYGQVVVAQPPGVILAGAGVLAIHDSLEWLRLVVGVGQLLAGLLAARVVWRLTRSPVATALTPAAVLLTPWAVHAHGSLIPELLAAPLLLGAALLATERRTVAAAAVLVAIASFVKWPFVVPAAAIVLLSANRTRALLWFAGTLAVEAAIATAAYGGALWRDTVRAQLHSGSHTTHKLLGIWGQAGWSLAGLIVAAAVCLALRRLIADRMLLRVMVGLSVGLLATILTVVKAGTGPDVLVPVEAVLVALALSGLALAVRHAPRPGGWLPAAAAGAGVLFTLAQTVSLFASPGRTQPPFIYPTSQPGSWGRLNSDDEAHRIVAAIRRCPPGLPYLGAPYFAFLAHRSMPDNQPDQFLISHSPTLRAVAAKITAVHPVCTGAPGS
ncbi:MAG TPA: hypothetical protein VGY97_04575 [Solirubrobacteraceae bacterium]|jgi:hypothetical protein|nr:hypothetical protein [Solirubrobacteraceae bacterium]